MQKCTYLHTKLPILGVCHTPSYWRAPKSLLRRYPLTIRCCAPPCLTRICDPQIPLKICPLPSAIIRGTACSHPKMCLLWLSYQTRKIPLTVYRHQSRRQINTRQCRSLAPRKRRMASGHQQAYNETRRVNKVRMLSPWRRLTRNCYVTMLFIADDVVWDNCMTFCDNAFSLVDRRQCLIPLVLGARRSGECLLFREPRRWSLFVKECVKCPCFINKMCTGECCDQCCYYAIPIHDVKSSSSSSLSK